MSPIGSSAQSVTQGSPRLNHAENATQERLGRLDSTRKAPVTKRLADMPKSARNTYLRAVSGRSPRAGIKAFCSECCGWQRNEVARCTALACPLYPYRPFQDVA